MTEKRVLVCDDDEFVYFTVETYMKKMGYQVLSATSGEEALESLQKHKPAIVFLDIQMPGMDGLELCRRIKSNERLQDIPVVFVSAKDVSGGFDDEIAAGGDYFVSKPFQPNDLAADLYFLAQTDFKPDTATLRRLRVARPLIFERAKREAEKATAAEQPMDVVQVAEVEHLKKTEDPDVRNLRMVVLGLARRLRELERLLEREKVIPRGRLDETMRASLTPAGPAGPASPAAPSAAEPPPVPQSKRPSSATRTPTPPPVSPPSKRPSSPSTPTPPAKSQKKPKESS